jgi:hypothetical protein
LLKLTVAAASSKFAQMNDDFMGADRFGNQNVINLAQLTSTFGSSKANSIVTSKKFL